MLPSHLQELLTAAVDGEMTGAEQRLVDKLLRDSEEARQFHTRLQSDAARLRGLPAAAPSDDLAANVMNLIDERCLLPTPLPMQRRKQTRNLQRLLPWFSVATAAGVIIAVSVFSYYYIAAGQKQLAKKQGDEKVEQQALAKDPAQPKHVASAPRQQRAPETVDVGPKTVKIDANPTVVAMEAPKSELLTVAPQVVGLENSLATPAQPEMEPFKIYQFHLPLVLPLRDLDEAYPKKRLREELRKDEVVRVDLFCKDGARAADLLLTALRSRGHQTLIDSMANDRIKKKMKSDFVFYTESMNADEIAKLLEQLGADDKKAETKKAGDGQFDNFVLAPFAAADLSELAKLIGVPPSQLKLPKLKTADATKSLESITANQLATNLPKSASRGNEKMTLVLPFGVNNHFPQNSKDIKNFLEKRGDRKTGAVPMMLILRTLN
jgi:hypothetical protein